MIYVFLQPVLIVLAIMLVRFRFWPIDDWHTVLMNWQEIALLVITFAHGIVFLVKKNQESMPKKIIAKIVLYLAFFFYVCSAVLSANTGMGACYYDWVKIVGVVLLLVSLVLHFILTQKKYYSLALYLLGLPLVFGSWMAIVAVPGALVLLKWLK